MIEGEQFVNYVKELFAFLSNEFNLKLSDEKICGNSFYDIRYSDKNKVISISYENIEDYLQVTLFKLENKKLPDYDDKTKTIHLNTLSKNLFSQSSKEEILLNNNYFKKFNVKNDKVKNHLIKEAKNLRLILKKEIV